MNIEANLPQQEKLPILNQDFRWFVDLPGCRTTFDTLDDQTCEELLQLDMLKARPGAEFRLYIAIKGDQLCFAQIRCMRSGYVLQGVVRIYVVVFRNMTRFINKILDVYL